MIAATCCREWQRHIYCRSLVRLHPFAFRIWMASPCMCGGWAWSAQVASRRLSRRWTQLMSVESGNWHTSSIGRELTVRLHLLRCGSSPHQSKLCSWVAGPHRHGHVLCGISLFVVTTMCESVDMDLVIRIVRQSGIIAFWCCERLPWPA